MNGEEAAALEGGEGSDEEDTTFKKMLRSKIRPKIKKIVFQVTRLCLIFAPTLKF